MKKKINLDTVIIGLVAAAAAVTAIVINIPESGDSVPGGAFQDTLIEERPAER